MGADRWVSKESARRRLPTPGRRVLSKRKIQPPKVHRRRELMVSDAPKLDLRHNRFRRKSGAEILMFLAFENQDVPFVDENIFSDTMG